ncbi:hypothetical protein [Bradyrhizobium sp. CCGUVB23]|uniref:hypothetical protein n=1 Tax=Bradyrhizobium sp. CCGUVB23 TaxID=2949630 RepID=UPI003531B6CA
MQLSSNAISGGSAIPRRFNCDAEDLSPPLDWQAAPEMTASFVLLCDAEVVVIARSLGLAPGDASAACRS